MKKLYKFLRTGLESESGNEKWTLNKWKQINGALEMCKRGFHCSGTPYQAFSYIQGEVLAIVEPRGKSIIQDDKECWESMRIVKAYKWTKKDSMTFAIYAAELVIKNFEKEYPNDKRPREAIKAAKKVLFHDTKKNRDAASDAAYEASSAAYEASSADSAAYSADSVAYAASAASSASYAADAAYAASYADSAAYHAASSADSVASAASAASAAFYAASAAFYAASAAYAAVYKKLGLWMKKRIRLLKPIK